MILEGSISYPGDGITVSTRAMVAQIAVLKVHSDNISNFGIPGYQRKDPVITSFVEHLGANAIDTVTSQETGRVRKSDNALDFALGSPGYFQKLGKSGAVELTRDGRMKLDVNGYLLTLDNKKVLGASGAPIKFSIIPKDFKEEVNVATDGSIQVMDTKKGKMVSMGKISVANADGTAASTADIKQGFVEDSNVYLQREFVSLIPLRRQFEANRQMFILQSDNLSRMIQELGRG